MIGGPWTREQKAAYRAAFSIGRIGDDLWTLIALLWLGVCVVALFYLAGMLYLIAAAASFAGLYWLSWQVLLPRLSEQCLTN
jgi:hypothetical protein